MYKIGIDARLYNQTGVGVYIRNLLYNLQKLSTKDIIFYIYARSVDKLEIQNLLGPNPKHTKFEIKTVDYRWHSLDEQTKLLFRLNQDELDLMHFTYFSYPCFYKRPFIITIHDLTPLLFTTGKASTKNQLVYKLKNKAYKYVLSSAISNSKAIITPTNFVKKQIKDNYNNVNKDKIYVTYEGINNKLIKTKPNNKLANTFTKPFFIYIGNFYPHKNVEKLVEAFSKTSSKYSLILIGPDDYFCKRIKKLVNNLNQNNRITLYNHAALPDLVFFYKNASALIHPSLSEGFGLPLVEATYFNCPIIASNIEVFKEVLGDKYLSFDPGNENDIKNTIDVFIQSQSQKPSEVKLESKFSFEKMAKDTVNIYKTCLVK